MSKVGDLVEFNRGDGPEYGLVVEVSDEGSKIAPVSKDATAPYKETDDDSVEGRGGEFRVL